MQGELDFLSALVLKDRSKWKANKSKHREGDNAHSNVRSKSNNNERKILNPSWNSLLQKKLCRWSLKCAKKQNYRFIQTYGGQIPHLLIPHLLIKPFEAPQRSVKIIFFVKLIFILIQLSQMNRAGRVKTRYFVKENKKPLTAIKTTSKYKNV